MEPERQHPRRLRLSGTVSESIREILVRPATGFRKTWVLLKHGANVAVNTAMLKVEKF